MGMTYPIYDINMDQINAVLDLKDKTIQEVFQGKDLSTITYRPLRPDDIDSTLNVDTRHYDTHNVNDGGPVNGFTRCLNAAGPIQVRAGNAYLIFGWLISPDTGLDTNSVPFTFTAQSLARVTLESVVKNEISPKIIQEYPVPMGLTLDQAVVITEATFADILFIDRGKDHTATPPEMAKGVFFPLGYRLGPESQLNQN